MVSCLYVPSANKDALTSFLAVFYFSPCLTAALPKTFSFEVFPFRCDSGYRFVVYTLYYAEMCSSYFRCLPFFFLIKSLVISIKIMISVPEPVYLMYCYTC